jgi:hypothetical protein
MSLLTVIQAVCGRTGIPVPSTVLGSTDDQVLQLLRLLEEDGNDLASRGPWEGLTFEFTHTSVADEDQGLISSVAPNGFSYIKNETFWDRTNKLRIHGPLSAEEWQRMKAMTASGPKYYYRIRGGRFLIYPAPTAGYTWAGEYVSKRWILGADGTTYKQYFTLDSDTMLLPEELHIAGLRWRWKKEKGFEYGEDFRTYEMQVKDALSRDGGKPKLSMDDNAGKSAKPGIVVPDMSWMS